MSAKERAEGRREQPEYVDTWWNCGRMKSYNAVFCTVQSYKQHSACLFVLHRSDKESAVACAT